MLTIQLGAVPEIVTLADGIKVVLAEAAPMAAQVNVESTSVMLTATPSRSVSSEVV